MAKTAVADCASEMPGTKSFPIETSRLLIRPIRLDDLDKLAEIVADAKVMRYIGNGSPLDRDQTEAYIRKTMRSEEENGYSRYAVCLRDSEILIGVCGFMDFRGEVDFGWRYARAFWGKGFATEAARAVLDYGVRSIGLRRIVCQAYTENRASIRVIEKLGIPFDGPGLLNGRPTLRYVLCID